MCTGHSSSPLISCAFLHHTKLRDHIFFPDGGRVSHADDRSSALLSGSSGSLGDNGRNHGNHGVIDCDVDKRVGDTGIQGLTGGEVGGRGGGGKDTCERSVASCTSVQRDIGGHSNNGAESHTSPSLRETSAIGLLINTSRRQDRGDLTRPDYDRGDLTRPRGARTRTYSFEERPLVSENTATRIRFYSNEERRRRGPVESPSSSASGGEEEEETPLLVRGRRRRNYSSEQQPGQFLNYRHQR